MATRITGTANVKSPGDQVISTTDGNINLTTSPDTVINSPNKGNIYLTAPDGSAVKITNGNLVIGDAASTATSRNVGTIFNPTGLTNQFPDQTLFSTTAQRKLASAYFAGGVGIEQDLAVGGFIYGRIAAANTATTSTQIVVLSTDTTATFYLTFVEQAFNSIGTQLYVDNNSPYVNAVNTLTKGLSYQPATGRLNVDRLYVAADDTAVSTSTGAVQVQGGAYIAKDVIIGGSITPVNDNTQWIGTATNKWSDAYLENIYTRFLGNTSSNITLSPNNGISSPIAGTGGIVDVFGEIRVRGSNPIGTAPIVTNILYVTMDGNDTNDGRAMDASRACRTVGGALNSPYYQPGTQIRVAPGHYLEDNPLQLKPYTSIVGSDLRTTSIEPINKTQDLFHLNSGCYLATMQFLNGRSGLLEGDYAADFNRGAYCTAFPPLTGTDRIDLYHSPYIQNCTNLSGPWLRDGTMFVPNQTIQVPTAVGTGTWVYNTSSIIVYASTGTIEGGMSINAGQQNPGFFNARTLLLANKPYLQEQTVNWINRQIDAAVAVNDTGSIWYQGGVRFDYNQEKCRRDVGILVENTAYDAAFGGNEKSVESGLAYYRGVVSLIAGQELQTTAAIEYLRDRSIEVIKNTTCTNTTSTGVVNSQVINWVLTGGSISTASIGSLYGIVTATIASPANSPAVYKSPGPDAAFVSAEILMQANRTFIQENTIKWITATYPSFTYNTTSCYRDVGLIIDAVSQDILLGGNRKSIEAGLSYWNQGYNYVANQVTTTTNAINYARDRSLEAIANTVCTNTYTGVISNQVINTFFQYGGDYMPQEAVRRNFKIITDIISNGPSAAPPVYAGGGLFALTGLNGADVKLSPKVTTVNTLSANTYLIGLNTSTVGFGYNATLYFGTTDVFPKLDNQVENLSLAYTGSTSTWHQRKLDPVGAMGGSLVDGAVVSDISPIQSFVYDAFTQLTQGGRGMRITNNGYAQLVSVFTIFCSTAVQVDNGGIASITNSNNNFGDQCLVAKGYGKLNFSGTVFNPPSRAYPFSPLNDGILVTGSDELDQYYPNGFWPNKGTVEIFLPDIDDRPHIGQVMEIVPPEGHLNEQSFPGFLNAQPSTSTLTTSTLILTNIDTTDVAVGNYVYIRGIDGREYDSNGVRYAATGTMVVDVNYNAIKLNLPLTSGGGDPTNPDYFTLYFCGNSYYTVLSSTVANSPYLLDSNILSANSNPNYQGPPTDQIATHNASILYLKALVGSVIDNVSVSTYMPVSTQVILPLVTGGVNAKSFIDNRFEKIVDIISAVDITAAKAVVPTSSIKKKDTTTAGAGSAITLIEANLEFLIDEVDAYIQSPVGLNFTNYNQAKCRRDIRIILERMLRDLETGGNYNSVMVGLSYWSRIGTHHIVELGEAVRRTDLFPDGSSANFYQRSYISASGYLFEYVGSGINYGSLPQIGRVDPVQAKETIQLDGGRVFFTSTDQNGDFRIGRGLVISQATGVLTGRTFTQSLFANMTPFILAIEGS
jgi:hypothetical protein